MRGRNEPMAGTSGYLWNQYMGLTAGIEPEIQRGLPYVYWIAIISLVLGIMGGTKLAEKGIETKTQGRR
jgi:hypothetical protein